MDSCPQHHNTTLCTVSIFPSQQLQFSQPCEISLWVWKVGGGRSTKGKIKFRFFFFSCGIFIDLTIQIQRYWQLRAWGGGVCARVPKLAPIHSRVITKIFALLTPIKMSGLVFWGCPSWAMVCWMNTRSVCRICQINFNSERIWAVNTQEIALLVWAWSVIQEDGEQRRQQKEKACQGNWIICGIIFVRYKIPLPFA